MLNLSPTTRIWICTAATDMRKGFDGLCGLIRQGLSSNPLSGEVFVFRNKSADRVKILTFEGDGLAIYYKRLEAGRFHFPLAADGNRKVTLRAADLLMLLDGVDLESVKRQKRYQRQPPSA